jgi:hypothetical protein
LEAAVVPGVFRICVIGEICGSTIDDQHGQAPPKAATKTASAERQKPATFPKTAKAATPPSPTPCGEVRRGGARECVAGWPGHSLCTHNVLFIRNLRPATDMATVATSLGHVTRAIRLRRPGREQGPLLRSIAHRSFQTEFDDFFKDRQVRQSDLAGGL